MQITTSFNANSLARKLRAAAAELRRARRQDLASEQFAGRLEAHADAMLRPEAPLDERLFALRERRLGVLTR
jgi:hypothetical protein